MVRLGYQSFLIVSKRLGCFGPNRFPVQRDQTAEQRQHVHPGSLAHDQRDRPAIAFDDIVCVYQLDHERFEQREHSISVVFVCRFVVSAFVVVDPVFRLYSIQLGRPSLNRVAWSFYAILRAVQLGTDKLNLQRSDSSHRLLASIVVFRVETCRLPPTRSAASLGVVIRFIKLELSHRILRRSISSVQLDFFCLFERCFFRLQLLNLNRWTVNLPDSSIRPGFGPLVKYRILSFQLVQLTGPSRLDRLTVPGTSNSSVSPSPSPPSADASGSTTTGTISNDPNPPVASPSAASSSANDPSASGSSSSSGGETLPSSSSEPSSSTSSDSSSSSSPSPSPPSADSSGSTTMGTTSNDPRLIRLNHDKFNLERCSALSCWLAGGGFVFAGGTFRLRLLGLSGFCPLSVGNLRTHLNEYIVKSSDSSSSASSSATSNSPVPPNDPSPSEPEQPEASPGIETPRGSSLLNGTISQAPPASLRTGQVSVATLTVTGYDVVTVIGATAFSTSTPSSATATPPGAATITSAPASTTFAPSAKTVSSGTSSPALDDTGSPSVDASGRPSSASSVSSQDFTNALAFPSSTSTVANAAPVSASSSAKAGMENSPAAPSPSSSTFSNSGSGAAPTGFSSSNGTESATDSSSPLDSSRILKLICAVRLSWFDERFGFPWSSYGGFDEERFGKQWNLEWAGVPASRPVTGVSFVNRGSLPLQLLQLFLQLLRLLRLLRLLQLVLHVAGRSLFIIHSVRLVDHDLRPPPPPSHQSVSSIPFITDRTSRFQLVQRGGVHVVVPRNGQLELDRHDIGREPVRFVAFFWLISLVSFVPVHIKVVQLNPFRVQLHRLGRRSLIGLRTVRVNEQSSRPRVVQLSPSFPRTRRIARLQPSRFRLEHFQHAGGVLATQSWVKLISRAAIVLQPISVAGSALIIRRIFPLGIHKRTCKQLSR
ncbi:hypothetical protein JCM1840_003624 [Sporobolomyces johnsonii]